MSLNILQIIPGSGGNFYCGNCLRDSKYVKALRQQGYQVTKLPMYLPLFADEHDLNDIPVFYGAISLYLKQHYRLFRHAPAWFDRWLNSGPMLKLAARMSGSTNARGLEDMTISMLMGEHGVQREELEKMVDWIAEHCNPDVVHISNALLLGLARRLKERLNVLIVCSLQDEDTWVEPMKPAFQQKIWELMHERSKDVDLFIPVSEFYAGYMKDRMQLPAEKLHTVLLGVDPSDYQPRPVSKKKRCIGYISQMNHANGLDILVDAFIELKRKPGFDDVELVLTGGHTGQDTGYIKGLMRKVKTSGLASSVEIHEDFDGPGRMEFFDRVSLISVPLRQGYAFGLFILEAMASGIPVVQPEAGAFPEIIDATQGGVLFSGHAPGALAESLAGLLNDPDRLETLSLNARNGVEEKFNIFDTSAKMMEIFRNAREKLPRP